MKENNELIIALVKTQLEIQAPKKDKINPHFKSRYCSLDSIYEAVRIPLAKNGLSLSHSVEMVEGKHFLFTTLHHISGEEIETKMPMFIDKMTSQGFGSALTYVRKSAVCSLLGLPTEEDDDGNEATKVQSVSQRSEAEELITYNESLSIEEAILPVGKDFRTQILKYFSKVANIEPYADEFFKLPKRFLNQIITGIKKRKESNNEAV